MRRSTPDPTIALSRKGVEGGGREKGYILKKMMISRNARSSDGTDGWYDDGDDDDYRRRPTTTDRRPNSQEA